MKKQGIIVPNLCFLMRFGTIIPSFNLLQYFPLSLNHHYRHLAIRADAERRPPK